MYVCAEASGGGDGSVRLWHVRPAVTSVSSVSSSYIDTAPPSTQVHVHSGTRALLPLLAGSLDAGLYMPRRRRCCCIVNVALFYFRVYL